MSPDSCICSQLCILSRLLVLSVAHVLAAWHFVSSDVTAHCWSPPEEELLLSSSFHSSPGIHAPWHSVEQFVPLPGCQFSKHHSLLDGGEMGFRWSSSLNWFSRRPQDHSFQMEARGGKEHSAHGLGVGSRISPFGSHLQLDLIMYNVKPHF